MRPFFRTTYIYTLNILPCILRREERMGWMCAKTYKAKIARHLAVAFSDISMDRLFHILLLHLTEPNDAKFLSCPDLKGPLLDMSVCTPFPPHFPPEIGEGTQDIQRIRFPTPHAFPARS